MKLGVLPQSLSMSKVMAKKKFEHCMKDKTGSLYKA